MTSFRPALPSLPAQAAKLVELGVHEIAGLSAAAVHEAAERAASRTDLQAGDALLVARPALVPPSRLATLLRLHDKPGFVVDDMIDVDRFAPTGVNLPATPLFVVRGLDRGDDLANWSPEEALPELMQRGRTPLLLTEGVHWALQQPEVLERNHCFMTIASRLVKPGGGFDARTPALWISNGTGRDGRERKDAPKVGWCWWRNRHTWLGIASAAERLEV